MYVYNSIIIYVYDIYMIYIAVNTFLRMSMYVCTFKYPDSYYVYI